jgi:hypothetical protein
MKAEDRLLSVSSADLPNTAAKRPWRTPTLTPLQNPAQAQGGLALGPEVILLLS